MPIKVSEPLAGVSGNLLASATTALKPGRAGQEHTPDMQTKPKQDGAGMCGKLLFWCNAAPLSISDKLDRLLRHTTGPKSCRFLFDIWDLRDRLSYITNLVLPPSPLCWP